LIGAEAVSEGERAAARERLEYWLARKVTADLRPLALLEAAWRDGKLPPDARGLAFRLLENHGALDAGAEDLRHIGGQARAALQRCGVRLGRHSIFMPALVRPHAARTLAILRHGPEQALFLPRPGVLSVALERARGWDVCAAAGYRACGRIAVRLDLVERLADALAAPEQAPDPTLARLIGRPARELAGVLAVLGYQRDAAREEGAPCRWRLAMPRRGNRRTAPSDNAFAALAEMLPQQLRRGKPG
jgi:ATP-dependent RNA helicase SUPV3L1/SUV3